MRRIFSPSSAISTFQFIKDFPRQGVTRILPVCPTTIILPTLRLRLAGRALRRAYGLHKPQALNPHCSYRRLGTNFLHVLSLLIIRLRLAGRAQRRTYGLQSKPRALNLYRPYRRLETNLLYLLFLLTIRLRLPGQAQMRPYVFQSKSQALNPHRTHR